MNLASLMYEDQLTSVPIKSSNFKYHSKLDQQSDYKYQELFDGNNVIYKLSKEGSQIIEMDEYAKFSHKSILEYFAA